MHNYYVLKITIPVSFDVNSKLKSDGWEGAVEVLHQWSISFGKVSLCSSEEMLGDELDWFSRLTVKAADKMCPLLPLGMLDEAFFSNFSRRRKISPGQCRLICMWHHLLWKELISRLPTARCPFEGNLYFVEWCVYWSHQRSFHSYFALIFCAQVLFWTLCLPKLPQCLARRDWRPLLA